jgi:hypothetical protein
MVASIAIAACDGGHDPTLSIGFSAIGSYADASRFRATVYQLGFPRVIDGPSMLKYVDEPDAIIASRSHIRLRSGSEVTVDVALQTSAGPATARLAWTPQRDWDYGVEALVDTHRPQGFCVNIVQAIPLPPASGVPADTLFIVQSGLPTGAVC